MVPNRATHHIHNIRSPCITANFVSFGIIEDALYFNFCSTCKKMNSNQDYIEDWMYKTSWTKWNLEKWKIRKMVWKNYSKLNILENSAILVVFQQSFYFSPINLCLVDFSNIKHKYKYKWGYCFIYLAG